MALKKGAVDTREKKKKFYRHRRKSSRRAGEWRNLAPISCDRAASSHLLVYMCVCVLSE